jgi:hypothetical protein
MMTIVLSGPRSSETQARNALVAAGHDVQESVHDHGLPEDPIDSEHRPKGYKVPRQAVAFLTVHGEDVDAVVDSVQGLHYRLRMHHPIPEPAPPDPTVELTRRMDAMQAEINSLRAERGAG